MGLAQPLVWSHFPLTGERRAKPRQQRRGV